MITLDTTRADSIGARGDQPSRTPHLDALAGRGTRFERCDTAAPITLPSHATLLTGLFPPRHGVRDNGTFQLDEGIPLISEALQEAGYDTAAIVSAAVLARHYGLDRGFRLYDDDLGPESGPGGGPAERRAGETTDAALSVAARLRPPYFLWVHYFDPHDPYEPPPSFTQGKGADPVGLGYMGEIAYMDQEIGRLLRDLPGHPVVLVVGDHGEMLGDHGEPTHGLLLRHGARRVPLLMAGDGISKGTVDSLVRTADVAPTLLALAGLHPDPDLDGKSLLPLLSSDAKQGRQGYSESFLPYYAYRWYPLRSISEGRWLYVHGPRSRLYDLESDPGELSDVADLHPGVLEEYRKQLEAIVAEAGEELEGQAPATLSPSSGARSRLESLGYLGSGGGGGQVDRRLPDPESKVEIARDLHEASNQVREGRCEEALPNLVRIARQDRESFPALNLSGLCLLSQGRLQSALHAFRRAAELQPLSAVVAANIGHCLLGLGRQKEARDAYQQAFELDPATPAVGANLARLLREGGDPVAARAVIAGAFEAGSHHPGLYLERGVDRAGSGDLPGALGDFLAASDRDSSNPVPIENAAQAALLLDRKDQAVELLERTLERSPERADLWARLGSLHYVLGSREAARDCLDRALELTTDPELRRRLELQLADLESQGLER